MQKKENGNIEAFKGKTRRAVSCFPQCIYQTTCLDYENILTTIVTHQSSKKKKLWTNISYSSVIIMVKSKQIDCIIDCISDLGHSSSN